MAEDKKKFDLKYFFLGDGLKDWFKSWGNGWRLAVTIGVLFLLILGIKSIFSKTQTQKTQIGQVSGDVNIIQKPSRFLIPFVEAYIMREKEDSGFGYGLKAGVRLEF
jgi:hypothetical protein